jgi:hypothetical protein
MNEFVIYQVVGDQKLYWCASLFRPWGSWPWPFAHRFKIQADAEEVIRLIKAQGRSDIPDPDSLAVEEVE